MTQGSGKQDLRPAIRDALDRTSTETVPKRAGGGNSLHSRHLVKEGREWKVKKRGPARGERPTVEKISEER